MNKTIAFTAVVLLAMMAFWGCTQPTDPPAPDPVKQTVSGLSFTCATDTSKTTTVYEWDNAVGTYYTTVGDVTVTTTQLSVVISGVEYVNEKYRDASRTFQQISADSITGKYWMTSYFDPVANATLSVKVWLANGILDISYDINGNEIWRGPDYRGQIVWCHTNADNSTAVFQDDFAEGGFSLQPSSSTGFIE